MLYMVVFATSVFILLAFIYWRTAGFMMEQTDQTIEAEIVGLAEQYRSRGINGLMNVIQERGARDPDGESLYLFTTEDYLKLAGNLSKWPSEADDGSSWIDFTRMRRWVGKANPPGPGTSVRGTGRAPVARGAGRQ